jgi:hypothetical protein
MTPAQRVKAVYQGQTPDQVPLMLDLSHWYKKNYNIFFDLSGFKQVEEGLVDLHKKIGAVSYVEMGSYYDLYFDDDSISEKSWTENGIFHHQIITPLGELHEQRVFEQTSYSYNIKKHLLETVDDFEIVCFIMDRYKCRPAFERYHAWCQALGDLAFIYCNLPYSGLGYLISRNFGVEKTCLAMYDHPRKMKKLINSVNNCNLRILDAIVGGPFDVVMLNDNFDSNVQNPDMFNEYTRDYYTAVADRLHKNGKYCATHVDGEMRGCLKNMAACGVDCIDAATPAPMFSLTTAQARTEAGPDLILSGGIPATVFGATGTDEEFIESVKAWLDTKNSSSRLILAAGDQVPPDAPWHRIEMLPELVETYGTY